MGGPERGRFRVTGLEGPRQRVPESTVLPSRAMEDPSNADDDASFFRGHVAPGWQASRRPLQLLGVAALMAVCLCVSALILKLPGFPAWWRQRPGPDTTNFSRESLFPDAPDLSPDWPTRLLGPSVRGPFVGPFSIQVAESCRGLPAWGSLGSAVPIGGTPISEQEAAQALAEAARLFNKTTGLPIPEAKTEGTEGRSGLRALLLVFGGGLGNGFMAVALGTTYAFLSGRRLVRYPIGRPAHGMKAVCAAFHCASVEFPPPAVYPLPSEEPEAYAVARRVVNITAREWRSSLGDPSPLVIIDSHGMTGNWTQDRKLRRCAFESFGCASKWCLDSRQLRLFLGAPTELLGHAIRGTTLARPPSTGHTLPTAPPLAPLQDWQHTTLQFARALAAAQHAGREFIYTEGPGRSVGNEGGGNSTRGTIMRKGHAQGGEGGLSSHAMGHAIEEGVYSPGAAQAREALRMRLLVRGGLRRSTRRRLQSRGGGTGASIAQSVSEMATRGQNPPWLVGREDPGSDDTARAGSQGEGPGRPGSVDEGPRNESPGGVHAGSAGPMRDAKGSVGTASGVGRMYAPSAGAGSAKLAPRPWTSDAAVRLEFDVGIHIRTVTPCIERGRQGTLCGSPGLAHTLAKAYRKRVLRTFLLAKDWLCISSLLAYLQHVKTQLAQEDGPSGRVRGAYSDASRGAKPPAEEGGLGAGGEHVEGGRRTAGEPLIHFPEGSRERGRMEAFLKAASPGRVSGLWTVGDALAFAQGTLAPSAGGRGAGQGLRIYLATDSEFLRPLFVELLRPFGHVVVSNSVLAHTGAWGKAVAEPRVATAKLVSLSEFFLLSKAAVALNFGARRSSFLTEAAKYGNTTLILRGKLPRDRACDCPCCFSVDHWAEVPGNQQN